MTQFLAWRIAVLHTFLVRCSAIPQRQLFLCGSTFLFKMPQRCSIGFKSGAILGQVIVFTFFLCGNACVILAVCFGSLPTWNIPLLPRKTGRHLVIQYFAHAFMVPSLNVISNTFCTHAAPYHHTGIAMLQCQDCIPCPGKVHAKHIYLGLIRPKDVLPTFFLANLKTFFFYLKKKNVLSWTPTL